MLLRLPVLILFLISIASIVQAADIVVVRSNSTGFFQVGDLIESTKSVRLSSKTEITVVFANGNVRTVKGPYQGKLEMPLSYNAPEPKLVTALSHFLMNQEQVRGSVPSSDKLWSVDVSTPKRYYCIAPANKVILWRSESQSASTLLIQNKIRGEKASVVWPANQKTLKWPSSLPVYYGETYMVKLETRNGSSFKKLVLYQLPESLPTKSHKVVWMVGRGCIPQANMLLASLR
jgi:hypothetical protein